MESSIMGRTNCAFLLLALISALLFLSLPLGSARRVQILRRPGTGNADPVLLDQLEFGGEMIATKMDYPDPGADTNPGNGGGALFNNIPAPPPIH